MEYAIPYAKDRARVRRGDRAEAGDRVHARRHAHRDRVDALAGLEGREPARAGAATRRARRTSRAPTRREQAMKIADDGRAGARRPRLHPRAPGRDVVPQRAHALRARRRGSPSNPTTARHADEDRMIDFTLTENDQKVLDRRARGGARRAASTRATTTRTSTSSRPTSCPRRRTSRPSFALFDAAHRRGHRRSA